MPSKHPELKRSRQKSSVIFGNRCRSLGVWDVCFRILRDEYSLARQKAGGTKYGSDIEAWDWLESRYGGCGRSELLRISEEVIRSWREGVSPSDSGEPSGAVSDAAVVDTDPEPSDAGIDVSDVLWIAKALGLKFVRRSMAPNSAAWALYCHLLSSPASRDRFWFGMYQKAVLAAGGGAAPAEPAPAEPAEEGLMHSEFLRRMAGG